MARKSNLIKREKSMTVYVYDNATAEELKEVERLRKLKWTVKPCNEKVETPVIPHEVTKEFNISFDETRKEDMVSYIKQFDKDGLKAFSVAAHKNSKGEVVKNIKDGKPKYFHLTAKRYFFEHYFPEKWEKIKKMLDERGFKKGKKKAANEMEDELLLLLAEDML